ncbi:MAG: dihydroorotase [Planctomycetota bacterium]|nr:dihydroorotase [Planctomycetota bacterium]MDA1165282.1 dihydroorotase [Planctomycetota bacterium]
MRTLIRNAMCVLPTGTRKADVLIQDSKILGIDPPAGATVDETIDAEGLHLIPGVIDDHVHFRDPGLTHKEDLHSGSVACAAGGVTTFLEMPNTIPPTTTQEILNAKLDIAASKSLVNYGFYIAASTENLHELKNATRTPGIKIFIGSSTGNLLVDDQDALEAIFSETSLPITAHCEDEATVRANQARIAAAGYQGHSDHSQIRNHEAARIATARAVDLARRHNHRFHVVHVSTAEEIALFADHGNLLTAEACPHHLFFNVDDYERLGSRVQMNPAVKTKADNQALLKALLDGQIQVVATDHAPHTLAEKDQPYPQSPSGLPAVENSLALMLDQVHQGNCSLEQVVSWMCDAPARVWDIVSKGRITEGYDADLVLIDLNRKVTIRNANQKTKCGWSPWDGTTLTGWPVRTFVMGRTVFADGEFDFDHRGMEVVFEHDRGGYWKSAGPVARDVT